MERLTLNPAILTYDLGTTRLKVAAFSPTGELLHQQAQRHTEYRDGKRRWQSASEWWRHCVSLTSKLLSKLGTVDVIGVSLCGRAGAAVFIDNHGKVSMDPWSDNRHSQELAELHAYRKKGVHLSNYAAALIAKTLWLKKHRPELAKNIAHVLYAKDFLLYQLSGVAMTDWSSGPDADRWDPDVLAYTGLSRLLPIPELPWTIAGTLTSTAASQLGLKQGTPIALGAHDGICANVGIGACVEQTYAITLGTHAVVRAVTRVQPADAYRFYCLPVDKHIIGGNAVMAGRSVDWFMDNWTSGDRDEQFETLNRDASRLDPGAGGVLFLPFLAGQVAPESRPGARAAFHGLDVNSSTSSMYRAVLEGSSFAIAQVFEQVKNWVGEPISVGVTGAGALSKLWTQIIADITGQTLRISDGSSEGRGAAIFLAVALGIYADVENACQEMVSFTAEIRPDPGNQATYKSVGERWRAFNDATRALDRH